MLESEYWIKVSDYVHQSTPEISINITEYIMFQVMRDSRSRRVARITEEKPVVETGEMEEEGVEGEGRLRSTSWSEVS